MVAHAVGRRCCDWKESATVNTVDMRRKPARCPASIHLCRINLQGREPRSAGRTTRARPYFRIVGTGSRKRSAREDRMPIMEMFRTH